MAEGTPPLQALAGRKEGEATEAHPFPNTSHLQPGLASKAFRILPTPLLLPTHTKGKCSIMVASSLWKGLSSPGWDGVGGRKWGGGHPALRPRSFQLGAGGENGDQTVETGSADRPPSSPGPCQDDQPLPQRKHEAPGSQRRGSIFQR